MQPGIAHMGADVEFIVASKRREHAVGKGVKYID